MKRNVLHEIMTSAWRMFRVTGESFSECLKRGSQVKVSANALKGHGRCTNWQKL